MAMRLPVARPGSLYSLCLVIRAQSILIMVLFRDF